MSKSISQMLNETLVHIDPSEIDKVIAIVDSYENLKNLNRKIKIKFTEDEYGKEAKKLGLPKYAFSGDAGFDLPVVLLKSEQKHGLRIFPGERCMIHTGMIMEFPTGYWGRITHRSSTENRSRLRIIEGTIDDYRGEILVQCHNMNTYPLDIEHGQKLAQLILCHTCSFFIEESSELRPSKRGTSGFGSTGK